MGKKTEKKTEQAYVVTTEHRGVFFGYTDDITGETITLKRARLCLYWTADVKGFRSLARFGCAVPGRFTPRSRPRSGTVSGCGSSPCGARSSATTTS